MAQAVIDVSQIGSSFSVVGLNVRPFTYSQYESFRDDFPSTFNIQPPDLSSTFPSLPDAATGLLYYDIVQ